MRRNKWAVGVVVSALSMGCGPDGMRAAGEGASDVMTSPLADPAWASKSAQIPEDKLTHLDCAFSHLSADGKCVLGDADAGIDKAYSCPSEGAASRLRDNFRALEEIKKSNPNFKVLISVGGWTWSKYFSQVAGSSARSAFV